MAVTATCSGILGATAHLSSSSAAATSPTDRDSSSASSSRSFVLTSSFHGHARLGCQLGAPGRLVDNHLDRNGLSSLLRQRAGKAGVAVAMAPPKKVKPKKVVAVVKLALEAGKATPAPPVGPALGAKGVNIMNFCKEYNAQTAEKAGYIIPAEITVYEDKSFTFVLKTPPASVLLKKAAGVERGSNEPHRVKVGNVTAAQILEIAKEKLPDLNCQSLDSAARIIRGTARNMGIDVVEA